MTDRFVVVIFAALSYASTADAHDLWLIPPAEATFGQVVTIRAVSGMAFPEGDHAPDPTLFIRRFAILPDGREVQIAAAGKETKAGLLQFTPSAAGVYVIGVETAPKHITLDAVAFNEYLVSDGMLHIYRLRTREKSLDQPGRERYSKSPKTLFRVGSGGVGDPCRPIGLPLEIVPLRDPFTLLVGNTLSVRVLFRGQPLADAILGWQHPGDGELPRGTVRTDAKGEALIPIAKHGLISIRLTHMTRPKTAEYEWESFWTSLTFQVIVQPAL